MFNISYMEFNQGVHFPCHQNRSSQLYNTSVTKLEDMLVMHCMTNAVLEYHFYLKIPSTNCSAKRSSLYNNKVYSKKLFNFVLTDDFS